MFCVVQFDRVQKLREFARLNVCVGESACTGVAADGDDAVDGVDGGGEFVNAPSMRPKADANGRTDERTATAAPATAARRRA